MSGRERRIRWYLILLVVNLAVIWGNSLLPAEESANLSGFVSGLLQRLFPGIDGGIPLRKVAHFLEFACLGAILTHNLIKREKYEGLILRAVLGSLLAACLDETVQIFVAGRSSSLLDVWIDFCGAAVGMTILLIGHSISQRNK